MISFMSPLFLESGEDRPEIPDDRDGSSYAVFQVNGLLHLLFVTFRLIRRKETQEEIFLLLE